MATIEPFYFTSKEVRIVVRRTFLRPKGGIDVALAEGWLKNLGYELDNLQTSEPRFGFGITKIAHYKRPEKAS